MTKKSILIFILLVQSLNLIFTNGDIIHAITTVKKYTNNHNINIYTNSSLLENLGFNNDDPTKNGEYDIIKLFIKKNDIIIDAGANIGDWSKFVLSSNENQCVIHAFEPIPPIYKFLQKLQSQFPNNFFNYNLALGKEDGELEINHFTHPELWGCSTSYDRPILKRFSIEKFKVPMTSLDKFTKIIGLKYINFLKIDTEGAELNILLGAKNLIQNNSIDIIQFEYGGTFTDAKITLWQIYDYLKSNYYLVFRIIPNGLIYIDNWNEKLENFQYSNYLAIKKL